MGLGTTETGHQAPRELAEPFVTARGRTGSAGEAGGGKGRRSWQIGADCPIIVDSKAFQQGHKSMADGDTMDGAY